MMCFFFFFFFKQKTAYEMRISDWSSDVCSSDLKDFSKAKFGGPLRPFIVLIIMVAINLQRLRMKVRSCSGEIDLTACLVLHLETARGRIHQAGGDGGKTLRSAGVERRVVAFLEKRLQPPIINAIGREHLRIP